LIYGGGGRLLDARPAAPGPPLPLLALLRVLLMGTFYE